MDLLMDVQTDRHMEEGWTDGHTKRCIDGQTDTQRNREMYKWTEWTD